MLLQGLENFFGIRNQFYGGIADCGAHCSIAIPHSGRMLRAYSSPLVLLYLFDRTSNASSLSFCVNMEKLYLSQRDIATLLGKLDSVRNGEASACTIIKNDTMHPLYPQTLRRIAVVAMEAQDRYMPGVSPRLHLSRPSLMALLADIGEQAGAPIRLDELEVFAVADDKYYVDRSATDAAPIGDLAAGFFRNRGKQN